MFTIGTSIETEGKLVVWGGSKEWGVATSRYGAFWRGDKMF